MTSGCSFLNGARIPFNNAKASGLFAGMTMKTDIAMLYTAVLEAVALDLSLIASEIEKNALSIKKMYFSGGGVRNELLLAIIAEVLEREIIAIPPDYDAAAGSAILAYQMASGNEDINTICKSIPIYRTIKPSGHFTEKLKEKKSRFMAAYEASCPIFESL